MNLHARSAEQLNVELGQAPCFRHERRADGQLKVCVRQDRERSGSFSGQLLPAHLGSSLDNYDPEALAMHCLLPQDDEIRRKDVPERFQDRMGKSPTVHSNLGLVRHLTLLDV